MKKLSVFLGTGFYAGYFPVFPGTAGTLIGVIIYFLLMKLFNNLYIYLVICVLFFITGYMTVDYCEDFFGRKDPPQIVIDEITGYLITMFLIPYKLTYILFGFILFRIFDIIKPLPINKIEMLPGAHGVMIDDVAAGIYACLVLHGYILFLK